MAPASAVRPTYDVVVVGLGIMGAAVASHLSGRGARVLACDTFGPVNSRGSSHGRSRIFRRAYWEGEQYVPLLNRSRAGWDELSQLTQDAVVVPTGGLFVGRPSSRLVRSSAETARRCAIPHELLDADEIRRRFPAFGVDDGAVGVYEPDALMIRADRARLSYLSLATTRGAHLAYGQPVHGVRPASGGTVTVEGDGWRVSCASVVLATGAWMGRCLPDEVGRHLAPMRIPVFSFDVDPLRRRHFVPEVLPVFLFEDDDGALVYGLPDRGPSHETRLKLGFHNRQLSALDPDDDRRPPTEAERLQLWHTARRLLPATLPSAQGTSCVYTMSRDESFLLGRSTQLEGVYFVSACSGHGFKFAPGIGEALAQLVLDGDTDVDLSPFDPERFAALVPSTSPREQRTLP